MKHPRTLPLVPRWPAFGGLFACLIVCKLAGAADPAIQLELGGGEPASAQFVLRGLPTERLDAMRGRPADAPEWQDLFAVFVLTDGKPSPVAMLGDYAIENGSLVFRPRYAPRPGGTYRAVARRDRGDPLSRDFKFADAPPVPPSRVTQIYPSADVLPENLLRFYLHFSAPMSRGDVYRHIRLLDAEGQEVPSPFLELSEELWSPDGKRFTLYFDPGRIKRGLQPRELFGPALREGNSYTLEIGRDWRDATGQRMAEPARKKFRVVAPDDIQPMPPSWVVRAPQADTQTPLVVEFDEPLDHAMIHRVLSVTDDRGDPISGTIHVTHHEQHWHFQPGKPWRAGSYRLVILRVLEDRAGNSIRRPFEVDILRRSTDRSDAETTQIPFTVHEAKR